MNSYTIFNEKDKLIIKSSFWAWFFGYKLTIEKNIFKGDIYINGIKYKK